MKELISNLYRAVKKCLLSTTSWRAQKKQNLQDNIFSGRSYLPLRQLSTGTYILTVEEFTNFTQISLFSWSAKVDYEKASLLVLQKNLSKKPISLALSVEELLSLH